MSGPCGFGGLVGDGYFAQPFSDDGGGLVRIIVGQFADVLDCLGPHLAGDRGELHHFAAGTADIVVPPSNALKLVNAIPRAWLAQFNGGGHAFMAQYPVPLADLINSFLELA